MEAEELKRKLMGLWEKTSHNSKEMISILLEYYFHPELIEYQENEGKVVSALFGIPYNFGFGEKSLKGLYIVALSSEEGFRKKGVLSELLDKFNQRIRDKFDFSFIVPHTELMADYYGSQNFINSFYILEERYTSLHNFKNDFLISLKDSDERIQELKKKLINEIQIEEISQPSSEEKLEIISFIGNIEKRPSTNVNLRHTSSDMDYLLDPLSIRELHTLVSKDKEGIITGVAFVEKEEMKRVRIVAYYVDDDSAYYALMEYIKHLYPDYSISVNSSETKFHNHALIQQTYVSSNPAGGDLDNTFGSIYLPVNLNKILQPLGMVRLLNFEHILQYLTSRRSDIEFKLCIRDYIPFHNEPVIEKNTKGQEDLKSSSDNKKYEDEKTKLVYNIKNGKLKKEFTEYPFKDKSILYLTSKEVAELLLRKNDSSNLIMEAFGIPRLNLQMWLLPC